MRIIAGKHRGAALTPPTDYSIRPTSDKVRGAIFNILQHASWAPFFFEESQSVLDVFCGTGAFGLEALSRGIGKAAFIDKAPASLKLARSNAEKLKCATQCRFMQEDASSLPAAPHAFDLVFLDPPYRQNLLPQALAQLRAKGWLHAKSVVVAETAKDEKLAAPDGLSIMDERAYGETRAFFLMPPAQS